MAQNLAEIADYIQRRKLDDEAFVNRVMAPKTEHPPEARRGLIEQRAGELIQAHPDRDVNVLQAGLDEIRGLEEVPHNYPVVDDLERLGKERLKRAEEADKIRFGDFPRKLAIGLDKFGETVGRVIDVAGNYDPTRLLTKSGEGLLDTAGQWIESEYKKRGEATRSELSPAMKKAESLKYTVDTGKTWKEAPVENFKSIFQGDAWKSPAKIVGSLLESAPSTAVGMGTAVGVTGSLLKTALVKSGTISKGLAGIIGGFIGEGSVAGIESGKDIYDLVVAAPINVLSQTKEYKTAWDSLKGEGFSDSEREKQARELIADHAATMSTLKVFAMTGLLGSVSGHYMGKLVGGEATGGIPRRLLTAGGLETIQETPQSGYEVLEKNLQIKKFKDPAKDIWEGVREASIEGGVQGFAMGLAAGGGGIVAGRESQVAGPDVDQGMAGGTGEVDAVARMEPEAKPGAPTEKSPAPSGETPMAVAGGEVDAVARPKEPKEPAATQNLDSFLDIAPEVPLPKREASQPSRPVATPASSAPAGEAETAGERPVSAVGRMNAESHAIPGRVMTVPTESLTLDSDRFQYKRGMGLGGAGAKLKNLKKYDPELGGVLAVWPDPTNGKTYVVNGHHRFELAQRTGHPDVAVHVLEAKDAEAARIKGALINIAEGQGTSEDAATIFRDAGITPERLETDHNISLRGDVAREGMALSRLEMGIFKRVQSGAMPRKWGVVIGENLPDTESQLELVKYLDKQQKAGKQLGAGTIGQLIEELKGTPRKQEEQQLGLFGAEAFSRPLLQERAEIRAYVIKRLAEDKRLFGAVANARKAERLQAEGNVLDVEKNLDIAEKSAILKESFEKLAAYGGPVSDMLNQAAEDYAAGAGKEKIHVKREFFNRIRKEIPALVRQGFGNVSERAQDYSGAEPSGIGPAQGQSGEPGREPFRLTPAASGASQLHLFPGPESRQGDLFKDVKEKIKFKPPKGQAAATLGSLRARQHTRMVSTGGSVRAESLFVDDVHAAAALLRGIRRQRQENLYTVTTSETGKILEIHRVSKGKVNEASAPMIPAIGRVFNIPGAHTVYLAHNHPSGNPLPSPADQLFTEHMRNTAALKDIRVKSIVLGETGWREIEPGGPGPRNSIVRTPTNERIPIKEGIVVREESWRGGTPLTGSTEAKRVLKDRYDNADGFLLLDQKHKDMAFLPWPAGKPIKEAAADIIAALDATNANSIVINSGSGSAPAIAGPRGQFITRLVQALHSEAQILDVIDNGKSWADEGHLLNMRPVNAREPVDAMKALNDVQVLRSITGEKPVAGMYPEAVRSQVKEMEKGFPGFAGRLEVLPTVQDLGEGNLARAGIDPDNEMIRGLHVTDAKGDRRIYLFADALESPRAVADTLMEEMFHDGISTALGEEAGPVLDEIYEAHGAEVREAVRVYNLNLETPEGRREAADEWLAKGMVNDTLPARVWQKIVAAVNGAFRKAGIAVRYSANEIKALARKAVEQRTATADNQALSRAKDLLKKGVSPRKVWLETGWAWKNSGWTFKPGDTIRKSKAPVPNSTAMYTGDREGKLAAKGTFFRHFKEFWQPLSTIPDSAKFLHARYKAMGTAAKALRYIEKIHKKLDAFTLEVKKDFFLFMDGQGDETTLPIEARTLAKTLKEKTTIIGQMLVDRGIISQKTFDAHKGHYVHYMYAAHVLGDKMGGIVTSTGKLDLSYAIQRQDLTADERMALGLIKDASIAVPVGMGKALIDIAKFDFLETIAQNDKWVWKSSIVEVPTGSPSGWKSQYRTPSMVKVPKLVQRKGKPKTVKMGIGKLVEEVAKYKEMAEKAPSEEVKERYELLKAILDKTVEETRNVPAEFTQLPTSKSYGPLAGAFVRKPIADDIMPIMALHGDQGKLFKTLVSFETEGMALFKMGKVALNLPTAVRNIISNFIQNNMRGRPAALIPFDWLAALRSMKAKDQYYEEAFGHGIFKTNWFVTEINDVLDEFRKVEGGNYLKVLAAVKKVAKLYGKIDDINKHAIFLQMRKDGHSVEESVLEAMKWGMDYSLASRSVKHLRRHLVPFASYNYKIAPLIAESLRKRPWVIAKYACLLPMLMEAWAKDRNDMDDDDWEELERQLPEYVKKSQSTMILPFKTPEGHWQWLNAEYFFPWGNYHNLFNDLSEGDAGEIYKSLGISNPFLNIARMVASARGDQPPQHPFYGTPIYNQLDPAQVKAKKTVEFLAFTWLPPMLSSRGALGYSVKAAKGEKDRWGKKVTPGQAVARWFGFNVVAVSPSQTRAIAAVKAQDLRKELYRIQNDPAISEERKEAAERRYRERLAQIARTGASGAVLPIKKQKGADPVYDELVRMLEEGASLPGPPSRIYTFAGVQHKMTDEQFDYFLDRTSRLARERLGHRMTSPTWRRATEEWRSERVKEAVASARKRARSETRRRMAANRSPRRVQAD